MVLNSRGKVFTVIYFSYISHTYIYARLALGMQIKRKNTYYGPICCWGGCRATVENWKCADWFCGHSAIPLVSLLICKARIMLEVVLEFALLELYCIGNQVIKLLLLDDFCLIAQFLILNFTYKFFYHSSIHMCRRVIMKSLHPEQICVLNFKN
jgi:hypothetical protein